jgi:hypothetical protein
MTTTTPESPTSRANLLSLPAELRLQIYGYLFTAPPSEYISIEEVTATRTTYLNHCLNMTQVCLLIRAEAQPPLIAHLRHSCEAMLEHMGRRNAAYESDRGYTRVLRSDFYRE